MNCYTYDDFLTDDEDDGLPSLHNAPPNVRWAKPPKNPLPPEIDEEGFDDDDDLVAPPNFPLDHGWNKGRAHPKPIVIDDDDDDGEENLGTNVKVKKQGNPRYSQTQHDIDAILKTKRALREKNGSGGSNSNDSEEGATARSATPAGPRQFGQAFSPTPYSPDRITQMRNTEAIQSTIDNEGLKFLRMLLSMDLNALSIDYSEDLVTKHLRDNGWLPNWLQLKDELPLVYDSLESYKASYLPLIFYDGWAQLVEGFHANFYGRLRLHCRHFEPRATQEFITIWLRGLVPSDQIHQDKFALENWMVIIHPTEGGPSRLKMSSLDSEYRNKVALGFVQSYLGKLQQFGDRGSAPKHLPVLGGKYDEEEFGSLTEIEYIVKVSNTEANRNLLRNQTQLCIIPVYYLRPSLRYVEALSLMNFKKGFEQAFLHPDGDVCQLNFKPPRGFKFFEKDSFNELQQNAIISCCNAVQQPYNVNKTVMIQGPPGTGKTHTLIGIVKNLFINCESDEKVKPLRILICAPSNGAIDEIALRLIRDRHFLHKFREHKLRIVRIGQRSQVHPQVKPYLLETLVDQNYQFCQRTRGKSELRDELLSNANVILSTLNSAQLTCMNMFRMENVSSKKAIRCVIVDEASQCTEPELLMPLIYPISKLILIGDHLQLPATVISRVALRMGYGRSMFERLYRHFEALGVENPMLTLCLQFRMEHRICAFPSRCFYGGQLQTPPGTGRNRRIPIRPYILFDIVNSNEQRTSDLVNASKYNSEEAEFVFRLILMILNQLGYKVNHETVADLPDTLPVTIGVITFYRGQKQELMKKLDAFHDGILMRHIDVNTVDAFQGQERDIVILSCVRAFETTKDNNSVGFVRSQQRMNVALTRAKSVLFICIHGKSFYNVPRWENLLQDAQSRNCFMRITPQVTDEQLSKRIHLPYP